MSVLQVVRRRAPDLAGRNDTRGDGAGKVCRRLRSGRGARGLKHQLSAACRGRCALRLRAVSQVRLSGSSSLHSVASCLIPNCFQQWHNGHEPPVHDTARQRALFLPIACCLACVPACPRACVPHQAAHSADAALPHKAPKTALPRPPVAVARRRVVQEREGCCGAAPRLAQLLWPFLSNLSGPGSQRRSAWSSASDSHCSKQRAVDLAGAETAAGRAQRLCCQCPARLRGSASSRRGGCGLWGRDGLAEHRLCQCRSSAAASSGSRAQRRRLAAAPRRGLPPSRPAPAASG